MAGMASSHLIAGADPLTPARSLNTEPRLSALPAGPAAAAPDTP